MFSIPAKTLGWSFIGSRGVVLCIKHDVKTRTNIECCLLLHRNIRHCSSKASSSSIKLDTTQPFAYYEILGIKRNARQYEVKEAYFKKARLYHPDINDDENARENFDKITEAYTTLIDLTQRYFYDQHGHTSEDLRKKGTPSIFDWTPKYSIYEQTQREDGETTDLEDWFKSQGHAGYGEKVTLRQRVKNAYVELRYGMSYYDFPWKLKAFSVSLVAWIIGLLAFREIFNLTIHNVENRRPVQTNFKWENDEIYDILWYSGARKKKPSSQAKGGLYHMPKSVHKRESEYSHTIYSNTRSRTKSKHIERHKRHLAELKRMKEEAREQKRLERQKYGKRERVKTGFSV